MSCYIKQTNLWKIYFFQSWCFPFSSPSLLWHKQEVVAVHGTAASPVAIVPRGEANLQWWNTEPKLYLCQSGTNTCAKASCYPRAKADCPGSANDKRYPCRKNSLYLKTLNHDGFRENLISELSKRYPDQTAFNQIATQVYRLLPDIK